MVRCSDERWGQKESDDLGDNVTWGYTRRIVEFLKEKVNWSSNQVKEGRGEKNREVRARTGKIYSSKHIYAYTHTYRRYTCLMSRSVCMLGHTEWVLQVLFAHVCMVGQYGMKKALMGWFQRALPALSASKRALTSLCNFPSLFSARVWFYYDEQKVSVSVISPAAHLLIHLLSLSHCFTCFTQALLHQ